MLQSVSNRKSQNKTRVTGRAIHVSCCCSVLQCVAVSCSVLAWCNTVQLLLVCHAYSSPPFPFLFLAVLFFPFLFLAVLFFPFPFLAVLFFSSPPTRHFISPSHPVARSQCVAVGCSCSVLQCVAVRCIVYRIVAVC